MIRWRSLLRQWRDGERAAISVETAVMLPLLVFLYLTTWVYFDAYRKRAILEKASFTVGDLLSRQTDTIHDADIEGLRDLFAFIASTGETSWLRVSEITRVTADDWDVEWSYATGRNPILRDSHLERVAADLPEITVGARVIIVQTHTRYFPVFNVGLPHRVMTTFTPTRTRYAGQLSYSPT